MRSNKTNRKNEHILLNNQPFSQHEMHLPPHYSRKTLIKSYFTRAVVLKQKVQTNIVFARILVQITANCGKQHLDECLPRIIRRNLHFIA